MTTIRFEGLGGISLVGECFGSKDDPTVLLLPAAGQTKELLYDTAEALADAGRFAVCLDPRGHGESDRACDGRYDLAAFAQDLKLVLAQLPSRSTVVAIGTSGLAAVLAIGEGPPQLVSALVLVGVTLRIESATAERIVKAMGLRAAIFEDAAAALAAITAVHPFEPEPKATDRLLQAFKRDRDGRYRWRGDPGALGDVDLPGHSDRLEAAAARIVAPTALIRGSLNESVSSDSNQAIRALVAEAELYEIEGAGHYITADRADAFNAILLDFLERKSPRVAISYRGGADPRVLRDALGCFGTGVTVVTTIDADGRPIGLTANSFTSVSLDPPLILFCLSNASANLETFRSAGRFGINVLHIGQQPTSSRFARRDGSRFEGVAWKREAAEGSPLLQGALAYFDCSTYAVHDGGDHTIFVGKVERALYEPHRDPLLFFRGKYRRLHFA